jgi:hypothetical protein
MPAQWIGRERRCLPILGKYPVYSRYCRSGDTGLQGIKDGHGGDRIKEDVQNGGLGEVIRGDSAVTSCAIRMHEMN